LQKKLMKCNELIVRMLQHIVRLLLFCALLTALVAQEILTNESIVKMVKAGVAEDVILEMVRTRPGDYVLTSDGLIRLKQQGVPAKILTAMVAKAPGPSHDTTEANEHTRSRNVSDGVWEVHDTKDEISGKAGFVAHTTAEADSNGRRGAVALRATCNSWGLNIEITYSSHFGANPGFKWFQRDPTILLGQVHSYAPTTTIRLSIDGREEIVSSESDNSNVASIFFTGAAVRQNLESVEATGKGKAQRDYHVMTPAESAEGADRMMVNLASVMASAKSAGTISDVFNAQLIKIELPLANGDTPIFEIKPQATSFKAFSKRCDISAAARPSETNTAHALSDTYTRMLELRRDNIRMSGDDSIDPQEFYPIPVCYSAGAGTKCDPSGEEVRVPGDLAKPLNWPAFSTTRYCDSRTEEEIVLKSPKQNDGKKRFLLCTDAFILAHRRALLIKLGAKDDVGSQLGSDRPATLQKSARDPRFRVILVPRTQVTVGATELQLRRQPFEEDSITFTVAANTVVVIGARTPEGWRYVMSKMAPGKTRLDFYGWAPPGSFPEQ
jgi:hypothetical protein